MKSQWEERRKAVVAALEADGLSYFRGGRVLPNGRPPEETRSKNVATKKEELKPINQSINIPTFFS
jgi:hypothetical protein